VSESFLKELASWKSAPTTIRNGQVAYCYATSNEIVDQNFSISLENKLHSQRQITHGIKIDAQQKQAQMSLLNT